MQEDCYRMSPDQLKVEFEVIAKELKEAKEALHKLGIRTVDRDMDRAMGHFARAKELAETALKEAA